MKMNFSYISDEISVFGKTFSSSDSNPICDKKNGAHIFENSRHKCSIGIVCSQITHFIESINFFKKQFSNHT